jgi:hypothetical protein
METALRLVLYASVSAFLAIGTYWIYLGLEKLAYEAYVPAYVEAPVYINQWQSPVIETGTSTKAR